MCGTQPKSRFIHNTTYSWSIPAVASIDQTPPVTKFSVLAIVMESFSGLKMYIKKQNMNLYHVNIDKNQYYLLQLSQRGAIKWLSKWMKPNCIGILSLNKFCTAIVIHDPFSFNTCAFQRWLEYGVCRRYSLFKIYNSWGKTKS